MEQRFLDTYAILEASQGMTPEKAMAVRNALRNLLRAWEDAHTLPHSFQTKVERGDAPPKSGHHNR